MNTKKIIHIIYDNIKTLIGALVIAVLIRSLLFQPFYIPSSSMEPTLLVGDRIFVSKYTYGFSKHSFPFSPNITNQRFFSKSPERGDLVVFKTPQDNRTDYIKRIIGLPLEKISIRRGSLYINDKIIKDFKITQNINIDTEISNNSFYVLSDNLKLLGNACDSILIGPIEKNKLVAVIV